MPPKKTGVKTEVVIPVAQVKTKIESALWQTRELCRKHHLQTWGKESLANQIYQDLLFIYHIPRLCREGILDIDIQRVGDSKISEVSYSSLLSLKEPELINASFKRLCKELQRCILKDLFYGREFILFAVEKKNPERYMGLLLDLLKYFASIDLEGYDSNAGYTYFKKDLNKAIAKTFGQFYTPSTVTYSVVKLVDPKIGEKTLDPSCGSCSFLAESANYIVKKEGVDIKTAFVDLYGTEVEFNIYAEGIMNMFINFGLIPDMKGRIREVDALLDMAKSEDQFDKIVANPPFGADASTFHEFYFKTELEEKGKRMVKKIVVNPEVKCQIPFTKTKESAVLFFQFIVQKLKNGGKAGVVMSATILNDGYKEMMEWFLKCCSLEKVVINPAGTFKDQGTGIETFSFIFTKGKPTTTVEIVMLGAEDDAVRTLTLDQIKEAGWKLQLKEEEKKVAYTGGYPMVKLGDICEFNTDIPKHDTHYGKEIGNYPFYTGAANNKLFTDTPDINHLVIIMNRTNGAGKCNLFIDKKCSVAGQTLVFYMKDKNECNLRYIYYYLNAFKEKVEEGYIGSNHKNISNGFMEGFQIIFPPLPIQQEIIANLDHIFANPQDMKDCLAFTDKAMDLMLKDPTGKQLEDVLGGLRDKRDCLNLCIRKNSQMAAVVRSVGARGFERKKLGDCLNVFKTGKNQNDLIEGDYPFYMANGISKCYSTYQFDGEYVLNGRCGSKLDSSCYYINGKFSASDFTYVMQAKSNCLSNRYLYNYIRFAVDWNEYKTGSTMPNLPRASVTGIDIPLPPLPIQHEVLTILNEMEAELQTLEQMAAKAEQRAKFILDGYLTPAPNTPAMVDTAVAELNEVPQDEIVVNAVEAPKPAKRILKLKKGTPAS